MSQRAYKSLVDILSLVCAAYFTVKLSRHTIDRVLGMEQPHDERYIVCPNKLSRQLYDWCPTCGFTWPYVQPVPAHVCPPPVAGASEAKSDAHHKEIKEEKREQLGQICKRVRNPDHRTAAHLGFCEAWLFARLERTPPPSEDSKTAAAASGGEDRDKKKDKERRRPVTRTRTRRKASCAPMASNHA